MGAVTFSIPVYTDMDDAVVYAVCRIPRDNWPSEPSHPACKELRSVSRDCCYCIEFVTPFSLFFSVGDLCTDLSILSSHSVS